MQVCYDGLNGISFDLGDTTKWEFVFLENSHPQGMGTNLDEKREEEEEEDAENPIEVLDMPPSWVDKLSISKEQFESKCPAGSKCIEYKNVKYVNL